MGNNNPFPSKLTFGSELAKKLNEGILNRVPTHHVQTVRDEVTEACEELVSIGARIRPLMIDGRQAGWVRGFHDTEKRMLRRWVPNSHDYIFRCLQLVTSLSEDEISSLSSLELRRLILLITTMGDRDASLYPYLSAFSTTRDSENLWHGGGAYSSFENKSVLLPDGKLLRVLCPPTHARLWASLCTYREQAKKRLDESWNAVLIMRPWAGKSVDGLAAELKDATKRMRVDALEPWENIVASGPDKSLDDGWAHLENMETREGMLKELYGMLGNDRHEQLMARFEKQQLEAAEREKMEIEKLVTRRGGIGINKETITVMTEAEVRQREQDLRKGKVAPSPPVNRDKAEDGNPIDARKKIQKYQ